MAKHTITGYITAAPITYGKDKGKLQVSFSLYDPGKYEPDRVIVRAHSFEVDVPDDFDCRPAIIKNLEAQKAVVRAEAAKKVMEIDDWIGRLLALENTVEAQ